MSIKSSNVWFLFKLKLMGLFILSLNLDLSLIPDYFIIERGVIMRSEYSLSSLVIYLNYVGNLYTGLLAVRLQNYNHLG